MNKTELVNKIVEQTGVTKVDAKKSVDMVLTTLVQAIEDGESVSIVGFGTLGHKERKERIGRNPSTGKDIVIPAKKVPFCKLSKTITVK